MRYMQDRLPAVVVNLVGLTMLSLFLLAGGNAVGTVVLIAAVWLAVLACWLIAGCFLEKRRLDALLCQAEQLEERYLLPEILPPPVTAEEAVYRRLLQMAEKSMLEQVAEAQRQHKAYREYIEQWVHEIKTPITAAELLCENHRSPLSREILAQLERITRCTEQALYYARSEHTEKDYLIRDIQLNSLVSGAIAENKYLLRQGGVCIEVGNLAGTICTDDKWVRFILDQIIGNAVKYRSPSPRLRFDAEERPGQVCLVVEDNGMGIPEEDLPRVLEKGFTGRNGRTVHSSTGMGLYLCSRLCDKLGIGLEIHSREGKGTAVRLVFTVNDAIAGVHR